CPACAVLGSKLRRATRSTGAERITGSFRCGHGERIGGQDTLPDHGREEVRTECAALATRAASAYDLPLSSRDAYGSPRRAVLAKGISDADHANAFLPVCPAALRRGNHPTGRRRP